MMTWYWIAYGLSVLLCVACLFAEFMRRYHFVQLGEFVIILLASLIPVMNLWWVFFTLANCEFWQRKVWSKQP